MGWAFDLRTAILLGAVVTLLIGALLLASRRSLPIAARPSLRWWLAGLLLHPLGLILVSLHDLGPNWLTIPVAYSLLAFGLACMTIAFRIFYGLREHRVRLFVIAALVALSALLFTNLLPNVQWRIISVTLLLATLAACSALSVLRSHGPTGVVPRLTGALFAAVAVVMLARVGHEAVWPSTASALMQASWLNLLGAGVLVLLPVLATVGFLLMCTERGQEELERTARMDYLTGIYNRRAIEDLASRAISASRRHGIPMAIMLVDVDHFKNINDLFGHEAGDLALIETVRRMRQIMRAEDLVGRQGGEEFVAVMPDIDLGSAHAAAERLRRSFADRPMVIGHASPPVEAAVTVSIGVAALEPSDLQFSHLLRRADRAMYAAKAAGRNKVMLDTN